MKIVLTVTGKVNWETTRKIVVKSKTFGPAQVDFGLGPENAARCAKCTRMLPTKGMHLDHILSQSRHSVTAMQYNAVTVLDSTSPHAVSTTHCAQVEGGTVTVWRYEPLHESQNHRSARQKTQRTTLVEKVATANLWKCDLRNLQWLCGGCNSGKREREWDNAEDGQPSPLTP
jgi:hypothetical protein